jgi:hypothetical protein
MRTPASKKENINALRKAIAQAQAQIEDQPDSWLSKNGMEVHKTSFVLLLSQWEHVCVLAKWLDKAVICYGD